MSRERPIELTAAQVAAITGVDPATVRSWIHRGHLTRTRRGTIDAGQLISYLDGRRPGGPGPQPGRPS